MNKILTINFDNDTLLLSEHSLFPGNLKKKDVRYAYLDLPKRGDISSLTWMESPFKFDFDLPNDDLEPCDICYSSINYKDIMTATGDLPIRVLSGTFA